ncbi:PIN domain-containing protein [Desulfurococcaceae archaeon AG1]|nr:PIN domain-containing protein [Desulfurococcaceae archaeon AG1]
MSRRGLRILVDTFFILPVLGFKTDNAILNSLPLLRLCDVYYSDVSILEALWKIVRVIKDREQARIVLEGAGLLGSSFKRVEIDGKALGIAIELYLKGHKDLIDNILYGVSISKNLKLLTIDKELRIFIKNQGLEDTLLYPEELARALGI